MKNIYIFYLLILLIVSNQCAPDPVKLETGRNELITKKEIPLKEINPIRYSNSVSKAEIKKFENSEIYQEFQNLRQILYSSLEENTGIMEIKDYLDEKYFQYSESRYQKDIFIQYKNIESLKKIEEVWDIKSIKNGLKNPYIFSIQMMEKNKKHYVVFDEYNLAKVNPLVDPPQQITFVYENKQIKLSSLDKVYYVNDR